MAGVELVRDRATKEPYPAAMQVGKAVCLAARRRGALLRPLGDVLVIMPPLAIELPLVDQLCDVIYDAIREVCQDVSATKPLDGTAATGQNQHIG